MAMIKTMLDFFSVESKTRPHIVNILRPRMLANMAVFFATRKFNHIKLAYKPINLMVEVSTACNLSCPTCERELYKEKISGIPKENVKLDNIKKLAPVLPYVYSVYLVGGLGEPFLNPEFWQIHAFFKGFGIKTGYFTNATILNEDLARKTFAERVNTVTISIDTFEKDKYCRIKKGADYNKAIEVIKVFNFYKEELRAKYFSLGLNFIFRKDNYLDILEYLDFAHELGVDYVQCTTLITHLERDRDLSFFLVNEAEKKKILGQALRKAKKIGIGIRLPNLNSKDRKTCGCLWRSLSIFYNGDVCACPFFRSSRYFYYHAEKGKIYYKKLWMQDTVVGNYLQENIEDIWNGEKIRNLRRSIVKGMSTSPCGSCYYKYDYH